MRLTPGWRDSWRPLCGCNPDGRCSRNVGLHGSTSTTTRRTEQSPTPAGRQSVHYWGPQRSDRPTFYLPRQRQLVVARFSRNLTSPLNVNLWLKVRLTRGDKQHRTASFPPVITLSPLQHSDRAGQYKWIELLPASLSERMTERINRHENMLYKRCAQNLMEMKAYSCWRTSNVKHWRRWFFLSGSSHSDSAGER